MNKPLFLLLISLIILTGQAYSQGVGIGTTTPDASAALDVSGTSKGLLIPRMSATDRQSIIDPAVGLMVFDSTNNAFYYFNGMGWLELLAGSVDKITDADGDTRIRVEANPDEDVIRFEVKGIEVGKVDSTGRWDMVGPDDLLSIGGGNTGTGGAGNTFLGNAAGLPHVNGNSNTAVGRSAMRMHNSGENNTTLGGYSLFSNAVGSGNTAIGVSAGYNALGDGNVFLGKSAGYAETGSNKLYIENTGVDSSEALIYGEFDSNWVRINGRLTPTQGITDADGDTKILVEESTNDNVIRFVNTGTEYFNMDHGVLNITNTGNSVFVGNEAGLNDDRTNNQNTFVGSSAGTSNTTGENNTSLGYEALYANTTGFRNTAIGYFSLGHLLTGSSNTTLGWWAGKEIITGTSNTCIGSDALSQNISGTENTALGESAGKNNQSGVQNTFLGAGAGKDNEGDGNVFIGFRAGWSEVGSHKLYISNTLSSMPLIYGEFDNSLLRINGTLNINEAYDFPMVDGTSGQILYSDGAGQVNWGDQTIDTDDQNLSLSGSTLSISEGNSIDISSVNTIQSILQDADGDTRIRIEANPDEDVIRFEVKGVEVGKVDSTGRWDMVGPDDLLSIGGGNTGTGGGGNTFLGNAAGLPHVSGNSNTAVGRSAMRMHNSGENNTILGGFSLFSNAVGSGNTAIGVSAGYNALGDGNVFLGKSAGFDETGSNKLYISNSEAGNSDALIYGEFDNQLLRVNGTLEQNGTLEVNGSLTATEGITVSGADAVFNSSVIANQPVSINGTLTASSPIYSTSSINANGSLIANGPLTANNTLNANSTFNANGSVKLGSNGTSFSGIITSTVSINLPNIGSNSTYIQDVTVTNATTSSVVMVSPGSDLPGAIIIGWARVVSANTVRIMWRNTGSNSQDPGSTSYRFTIFNF